MTAAAITGNIVVVSDVPDRELDRVRSKLNNGAFHAACSREALKHLLEQRAAGGPQPGSTGLDLVGHSVEEHLLELGGWKLDENAPGYFRDTLRPTLNTLGVKRIRLLGCSTATTKRSWRVICAIASQLGGEIEVFGARRLLDDGDYGGAGFVATGALVGTNGVDDASQRSAPPPLDHARRLAYIVPQPGSPTPGAHVVRRALPDTEHTCYPALGTLWRRPTA